MDTCPACHTPYTDDSSEFCPKCGIPRPKPAVCQNCGAMLRHNARFCEKCGAQTILGQKINKVLGIE